MEQKMSSHWQPQHRTCAKWQSCFQHQHEGASSLSKPPSVLRCNTLFFKRMGRIADLSCRCEISVFIDKSSHSLQCAFTCGMGNECLVERPSFDARVAARADGSSCPLISRGSTTDIRLVDAQKRRDAGRLLAPGVFGSSVRVPDCCASPID